MNNILIWNPWFIRIWSFSGFLSYLYDLGYFLSFALIVSLTVYTIKKNKILGYIFLVSWLLGLLGFSIYDYTSDNYALSISGEAMVSFVSTNPQSDYAKKMASMRDMLDSKDITQVSHNSQYILESGIQTGNFIITSYENHGNAYGDTLLTLNYIKFSGHNFTPFDYQHISKNSEVISHHSINLLIPNAKYDALTQLADLQNSTLNIAIQHLDKNTPFFKQKILDAINAQSSYSSKYNIQTENY